MANVCIKEGCENEAKAAGRYCRSCHAAYMREWRRKQRERWAEMRERWAALELQRLADKYADR